MQTIFREIMSACRSLEKRVTVAFLGPTGTFSEQAVLPAVRQRRRGLPCISIDEVFRATEAGTADFGVVPVENSSEGAINRTLDLMLATTTIISGEDLDPGASQPDDARPATWTACTVVCAHSQALAQCQVLAEPAPSGHRAARRRLQCRSGRHGQPGRRRSPPSPARWRASSTSWAWSRRHIQDDPHNRTRFAVIGHLQTDPSGQDQTSLVLAVPNKAGAVYNLLAPLADTACR